MKTLLLVPALLLFAGCADESRPATPPEEPAQVATRTQPTLSGRPTFIAGKDVEVVLDAPEVRELGGRSFLVGREDQDAHFVQPRFGGGTVWVPLDTVTQVVELEAEPTAHEHEHARPAEH